MPFEIVRNDIVNMRVDAIVNTANPKPVIGFGTDFGIHKKAGRKLLKARKKIGSIEAGHAAITPAFNLDAKFVIHTVGPVWQDGSHEEEKLLAGCYRESLQLAKENDCESIAFPLISTGTYGFPKTLALQIAVGVFSSFLMENDMRIYLVVFNRDAVVLSEKLVASVSSYIDENYVQEKTLDEYGGDEIVSYLKSSRAARIRQKPEVQESYLKEMSIPAGQEIASLPPDTLSFGEPTLEQALGKLDAGFSETLLHLIDRTGKKDSEIYKKANIDRKLFSKIRNNVNYKPSKPTALAFAIALELDLEETKEFIARAGYALSHSSKFDIIVEYFIQNNKYDIFELNEVLFAFDQPLIGS